MISISKEKKKGTTKTSKRRRLREQFIFKITINARQNKPTVHANKRPGRRNTMERSAQPLRQPTIIERTSNSPINCNYKQALDRSNHQPRIRNGRVTLIPRNDQTTREERRVREKIV